jgi:hypothetical protein
MYHMRVDWQAFISDYVAGGGNAFVSLRAPPATTH